MSRRLRSTTGLSGPVMLTRRGCSGACARWRAVFPKILLCVRCVARRPDGFCGVGDHAWPTVKTPTDGEAFPSRAHPTGGVGSAGPVPLPRTCRRGERLRCLPGRWSVWPGHTCLDAGRCGRAAVRVAPLDGGLRHGGFCLNRIHRSPC